MCAGLGWLATVRAEQFRGDAFSVLVKQSSVRSRRDPGLQFGTSHDSPRVRAGHDTDSLGEVVQGLLIQPLVGPRLLQKLLRVELVIMGLGRPCHLHHGRDDGIQVLRGQQPGTIARQFRLAIPAVESILDRRRE